MGRPLLEEHCLWAIGKPIWLVSLLLWMRAVGSLAGDCTAILHLPAEAARYAALSQAKNRSPTFEHAPMKCSS